MTAAQLASICFWEDRKSVAAIVANYREKQSDLKGIKKAIAEEQLRKIKAENDAVAGLMVERAKVVEEFRKVVEPLKAIIRIKTESELPLAMAGLDIPQARIFGKRFGDSLLVDWQKLFGSMGI